MTNSTRWTSPSSISSLRIFLWRQLVIWRICQKSTKRQNLTKRMRGRIRRPRSARNAAWSSVVGFKTKETPSSWLTRLNNSRWLLLKWKSWTRKYSIGISPRWRAPVDHPNALTCSKTTNLTTMMIITPFKSWSTRNHWSSRPCILKSLVVPKKSKSQLSSKSSRRSTWRMVFKRSWSR